MAHTAMIRNKPKRNSKNWLLLRFGVTWNEDFGLSAFFRAVSP